MGVVVWVDAAVVQFRPCHSLIVRAEVTYVWTNLRRTQNVEINERYVRF